MIAAIHQPNYIPWLGYFYKIAKCDTFVVLDNVQLANRGFTNRNKVKSPTGELWLTLPVDSGVRINEAKIKNHIDWKSHHINVLNHNYKRAQYFSNYIDDLIQLYNMDWEYMCGLNVEIIKYILKKLGLERRVISASSLNVEGKSTELLLNICKEINADTYLSGVGGKKYLEESRFQQEGINLAYSHFQHPVYRQLWGDFIPNLSVLDLLFNCGDSSLDYILLGESI